jgi:hypothetical protein
MQVRTLLDKHGYTSQEGVNLFLIGMAHSNVFDGEKVLKDRVQVRLAFLFRSSLRLTCTVLRPRVQLIPSHSEAPFREDAWDSCLCKRPIVILRWGGF